MLLRIKICKWNGFQEQLVFSSLVKSGFLTPKWATVDRNRSKPLPILRGPQPNRRGPDRFFAVHATKINQFRPVFCCKICCTNKNHLYLNYHHSGVI
ncbi:hypothetical protein K443DRAFT_109451 [Laccaria amethystina LaAM-08-1]|uniref:Uncharacterized protein n=1 Tax=Laccaria amethystina LaAM-08-1 TaxID=1095629 RepID=A0A0C9WT69_9AGAR|nr:hypothetical protein K443DRAFT_109451 [Laccaria amethystina LaAM-08-1]